MHDTIKLFCCDLNWSKFDTPIPCTPPSTPYDWAFIDPQEYFDWHQEFGNNVMFCQAYVQSGYALYDSQLGPVAPGPGRELFPKLYELSRAADVPVWSYMSVGSDAMLCNLHYEWLVPNSREHAPWGFFGPETPWTDLLCARIREFLTDFPVDWLLLDWFVYGSLKPNDFQVQPAWFVEQPFAEIIGRPMPAKAEDITPEESLAYKRAVLSRQFYKLQAAVKETSPGTKIIFNVPYWEANEALWEGHPMLLESDGLFAECSKPEVVDWLLEIKRPEQRVMTTVIGRQEDGECDPNMWQHWVYKGCDLFGYAWGTPPDFRPHPSYAEDLAITRAAFQGIGAEASA